MQSHLKGLPCVSCLSQLRSFLLLLRGLKQASRNQSARQQIAADGPVAHWSFEQLKQLPFEPKVVGDLKLDVGPRSPEFPRFQPKNNALRLNGRSYLRIKDPGDYSKFDFDNGDAITIEAWVAPDKVTGYNYIVGKGRTFLPGQEKENHNWGVATQEDSRRRGDFVPVSWSR